MMYMKHYISSTRHLSWFSNLVWPQRQPMWRLWPVALVARVAAPRCGSRIGQKPPESPRVPDDVQSDEVEHVHVSCNAGIMGYNIHIILKTPMTNKHWILERMHSSPENLVGYLIHTVDSGYDEVRYTCIPTSIQLEGFGCPTELFESHKFYSNKW